MYISVLFNTIVRMQWKMLLNVNVLNIFKNVFGNSKGARKMNKIGEGERGKECVYVCATTK